MNTKKKKVVRAIAPDKKRIPRAIRFSDQEWKRLRQLAKKAGVKHTTYVRQKALQE